MAFPDDLWGPAPYVTPIELAALECAGGLDPDVPGELVDLTDAVTQATQILFMLSGQTMRGLVTETVRPCLAGECRNMEVIPLHWPVSSISSVKLDGEANDEWFLTDDRDLRRAHTTDGRSRGWPTSQRLDLADTEVGTFSVTYTHGLPIPLWAQAACEELACSLLEFALQGSCNRLPDGVQSLNRQGVSYSIRERTEALRAGMTPENLPAVVRFYALSNSSRSMLPVDAYSPDIPKLHQITITPGS